MPNAQIDKEELIEKMAENLPMLRTKLGLTQEEMASMIGVSRHTVISMENQKRPMTWNTFLSLILIFSYDHDTKLLMRALGIFTVELEDFLVPKKKKYR
ncbi:MAG: helix-turn-helix domain-containing protein [Clostridia bacterium]|nr:helix-turn-helix domain-containing protein [Clostridia bacterium]MBQ8399192.1 helix-turn-helix domain-containing protein [Clostridia bacterium]